MDDRTERSDSREWEPHRELLHGIQDLRQEFGDFSVAATELRITDPTPEGIRRQLEALHARLTSSAAASGRA